MSIHARKEALISVETVTPAIARTWLALSEGNRNLRPDFIASLAAAMVHKTFLFNGEPIGFDSDGVLVNGHHRLSACVLADTSFITSVIRGLDPGAVKTIDTGLARKVADRLKMEGGINNNNAAAITAITSRLITGYSVQIRDFDTYTQWTSVVAEGHKFVMDILVKVRFMRNATISGAIAFAFKANPERVAAFTVRVRDGEGLSRGDPAFVLREYLMLNTGKSSGRAYKQSATEVSHKVLNAIYADIHGQKRIKLATNIEAYEYFRSFYSRGAAAKATKETLDLRNGARNLVKTIEYGNDDGNESAA